MSFELKAKQILFPTATSLDNFVIPGLDAGEYSKAPKALFDARYATGEQLTSGLAGKVADDDVRLTNARTPTGAAGGVLTGSYPNPGFAVDMATQAELDAGLATKVPTARTINDVPLSTNVVLTKVDIGLANVDNTADTAKPVSTAQQTALNGKEDSQTAASQAEAEAGSVTAIRKWTPERIKQAILALAPSGGDSAYTVAVNNGFVGNEAAWLASLVGADGPAGETGATGADGASAYALAVANGFVGDEAAWLASLVGPTGADGVGVPAGGTTGQFLTKNSNTDFDTEWSDPPTPTGAAGGVLTGSYPNPGFAVDMATQAELDAGLATKANASHTHSAADITSGTLDAARLPALPMELVIACSDETTALTTGTAKVTFRMPRAMTLIAVRASVTTAPTGSTLIVDINEGGTSILGTKLSIDATERTSTTAASTATITDAALADDAEITIDIDQIGSAIAGAGLKVTLIGTRA